MVAFRICCQVVLLSQLVACAGDSRVPDRTGSSHGTPAPVGPLDFGWRLSGDRAVAPLQVFSDSRQTWLQWTPGQSLPAILAVGPEGEHVLAYTRQEPYTIIDGRWPRLAFRAGSRQALARKRGLSAQHQADMPGQPLSTPVATDAPEPVSRRLEVPGALQEVAASPDEPTVPVRNVYSVTPDDGHLRQALSRWTGLSGWRFQSEHWAVDVDVPISAGASFGDDFVQAVQSLVATTELSDRPLQPCFYSNQVLRIVVASEPCDRTTAPGGPA